MNKLH